MPKNKKSSAQKSVNKRLSKLKVFKPASRIFNRKGIALFVLLFAAVGGFLVFRSFAADFNSNDEKIQYADINNARAAAAIPKLAYSSCLNGVARAWSKHMATTNGGANVDMTSTQIKNYADGCASGWTLVAENTAGTTSGIAPNYPSCLATTLDTCSQEAFVSLMASPPHKANILYSSMNYVGVGAYRGTKDITEYINGAWTTVHEPALWITHVFLKCSGCNLPTYSPIAWDLTGGATSVSPIAARAVNITANAGQTVGYYYDVKNNGPNTATYPRHVDNYHYSSTGALLSKTILDSGTSTTGKGSVYSWAMNLTIPSTAVKGEKYCHAIWFGYAFGPGTGGGASNTSCITVN